MDWEIYDGQKQLGPMPEAGVFDAIRDGLPRNAYVRQRGTSEWMPLETHPLFAVALQHRRAPGQWAPPPPPPPPLIGAAQPVAVEPRPPPNTPYAVASPHAGKPARRQIVGRGCLVQALGGLLLVGAGVCLHGDVPLAPRGRRGDRGRGVRAAPRGRAARREARLQPVQEARRARRARVPELPRVVHVRRPAEGED